MRCANDIALIGPPHLPCFEPCWAAEDGARKRPKLSRQPQTLSAQRENDSPPGFSCGPRRCVLAHSSRIRNPPFWWCTGASMAPAPASPRQLANHSPQAKRAQPEGQGWNSDLRSTRNRIMQTVLRPRPQRCRIRSNHPCTQRPWQTVPRRFGPDRGGRCSGRR